MNQGLRQLALVVPFVSIPFGILSSQLGWFGPSIENASAIRGFTTQNLIQPADYAFSIWGPIYLGVLALAVVQALPQTADNPRYQRARVPLILNMVVNFFWFVATQAFWDVLSFILLAAMLVTAVWLYYALEIPSTRASGFERVLRVAPSLYAGWLTVANVVTVANLLLVFGWSGFGVSDTAWAIVMLLVASALGLFIRLAWRDPVYGGVFVWAFIGIAVKAGQPQSVVVTAWVLAAVMLLSLLPAAAQRSRLGAPRQA